MNKKLYKFYWDCGRMGELEGLFLATAEEVENAVGKHIYFGECLGKHSEISDELYSNELEVISSNSMLIELLKKNFNSDTLCGYNPLDYLTDEEE